MIELVLLSLLFTVTVGHRCVSGPYLFDEACFHFSQGIGSSINKMKLQILAAQLYNLTVIPNPSCFMSSEHSTNFLSVFGWDIGLDCLFDDINKTEISIIHRVPIMIKEEFLDSKEPFALCNAYSFGDGRIKQEIGAYTTNDKHGIWGELSRAVSQLNEKRNSTVFVIQRPYYSYNLEGYQCSRDFIVDRFYLALKNDNPNRRAISYNRDKINIAFHFRYGDTAKADPNYPKEPNWDVDYSEQHRLPLKLGIALLQSILGSKSALNAAHSVIHFFSEGDLAMFKKFSVAFPDTVFHIGNESTVLNDLDHMAHADILLGGPSSFTSLAAALNRWGVNVMPAVRNPAEDKFAGMGGVVRQHRIVSGDLSEFNAQLCAARLYVTQTARSQALRCSPG
mmetsp:Transcript_24780/g.34050  ORF Transcript_24780/g.34050 Transcript_24780/m.34050 type:complete len:394 (-) Transcript_24780:61-1242(-)